MAENNNRFSSKDSAPRGRNSRKSIADLLAENKQDSQQVKEQVPTQTPSGEARRAQQPQSPTQTPSGEARRAQQAQSPTQTPSGEARRAQQAQSPTQTPNGEVRRAQQAQSPTQTPNGEARRVQQPQSPTQTPNGEARRVQQTQAPTQTPSGEVKRPPQTATRQAQQEQILKTQQIPQKEIIKTQNAAVNKQDVEQTQNINLASDKTQTDETVTREKTNRYNGDRTQSEPKKKRAPTTPENKKKLMVYNVIIGVLIAVFLVSGYLIISELVLKPMANDSDMDEIQQELEEIQKPDENEDETSSAPVEDEVVEEVGLSTAILTLKEKYPDVAGWLKIDNTDIHFPVMKSSASDPEYYLYRNYKGEDIKYGSIFYDQNSYIDSENQVLHGHAMFDKRMFYILNEFTNIDVYKQSPVVEYSTYEEDALWKIFAVFVTNVNTAYGEVYEYYDSTFATDQEKSTFLTTALDKSVIDTGVDVNLEDDILTLSTCTMDNNNQRVVVMARKVRYGEDPEVDTSLAVPK